MASQKKVYWQTVLKWAVGLGLTGGTAIGLYFAYLSGIGAITITAYSNDSTCAGTIQEPCVAYINFTANQDVFWYPMNYDPWGRETLFNFSPAVSEWHFYRSWGSGWREIYLDRPCTGTWCGAPANTNVSYSWVTRAGTKYQVKVVAYKYNINDTIKWSYDKVDPIWKGYKTDDFFVKLVDNQADLTQGTAIFNIKNPTSFDIPFDLNKFKVIVKESSGKKTYKTDILYYVNWSETITKPKYSLYKVDKIVNETVITEEVLLLNGTYTETLYYGNYIPINFSVIKAGQSIRIKIISYWGAQLGEISKEWVPSVNISGIIFEQDKWSWWNTSSGVKRNITVGNARGVAIEGVPLLVNMTTANTTSKGGFLKTDFTGINSNLIDVRMTEGSETTLQNYNIDEYGATPLIWYGGDRVLPAAGTNDFIYYNNSGMTAAGNKSSEAWHQSASVIAHFNNTLVTNSRVNMTQGTLVNAPTATTGCIFGNCMHCDGSDDGMDWGNSAATAITATDDLSIEFWMKAEATGANRRIVTQWGAPAINGLMIRASSSDGLEVASGTSGGIVNNTFNISDGNWHYIVYRLNRTEGRVTAFVDTVVTHNYSMTATLTPGGNLRNCYPHFDGEKFHGLIDEFRVYKNWTMTGDYMSYVYNQGLVTLGIEETQAPVDTCTYTSGNWNVDCSDNCVISAAKDLGGNDLIFTGAGTFTANADITNIDGISISTGCKVIVGAGKKFG